MVLDLRLNFVSAQYLENQLTEFYQILYLRSSWQDLAWDCYTSFFAYLYQSYGPVFVSELWPCIYTKNFVSAQYLGNQLIEFHQILYMLLSWQDLARDCYTSFFAHLYQSYGP